MKHGKRCAKCLGYKTAPAKDGAWCRCAVRRKPGSRWRVKADYANASFNVSTKDAAKGSAFDEVCVDDWLHVEHMDTRDWWMNVCGIHIGVHLPRDPKAPPRVTLYPNWSVNGSDDAPTVTCDLKPKTKGRRRS